MVWALVLHSIVLQERVLLVYHFTDSPHRNPELLTKWVHNMKRGDISVKTKQWVPNEHTVYFAVNILMSLVLW